MILLGSGCVNFDHNDSARRAAVQPADLVRPAGNLAPVVTAEQVTADNARQMAQNLWDELDRAELDPLAMSAPDQRK